MSRRYAWYELGRSWEEDEVLHGEYDFLDIRSESESLGRPALAKPASAAPAGASAAGGASGSTPAPGGAPAAVHLEVQVRAIAAPAAAQGADAPAARTRRPGLRLEGASMWK